MPTRKPSWLSLLKDYWWLGGIAIAMAGTISLYAAMPKRIEKVEAKNEQQDAEIVDLKGVASKIAGYTEALTKMQSQAFAPQPSQVSEVSDDGEIKVMRMDGRQLCCDGTDCWAWHPKTRCAR